MMLNLKNYQIDVIGKALNYLMPFSKGRVKTKFIQLLKAKRE